MDGRADGRSRSDDDMTQSVRTYGSKRPCWQDKRERTAAKSTSSDHGCSRQAIGSLGLLRTDHEGQGTVNEISTTTESIAIERYGAKESDRFHSKADEIEELIRQIAEGGDRGRASATALAKACKSSETRKVFRRQGKILGNLTEALSVSLGADRKLSDEALIHCVVVAIFILSKDASVAREFSASAVSTIASLIVDKSLVSTKAGLPTSRGSPDEAESFQKDRKSLAQPRIHSSLSSDAGAGRARETFSTLTNDHGRDPACELRVHLDEAKRLKSKLGRDATTVGSEVQSGAKAMQPGENAAGYFGALDTSASSRSSYESTGQRHGSTDALVRARMLLDISDMIPWGMANRHLVSVSDLGLTTLLNIAYQAYRGGKGGGGGIASGLGGVNSQGDDPSSQDSGAGQSEPSQPDSYSPIRSATAGTTEGESLRNTGVMQELSRLGPDGFLLTIVVKGGATLEALGAIPQVAGVRNTGAGASGAGGAGGVDPSSQRELHRLLQGLRLLDLATLHSSADGTKDAATANPGVDGRKELTGALLVVVARCQALLGDRRDPRPRYGSPSSPSSPVAIGRTRVHKISKCGRSSSNSFGDEIAPRVHECLLAALRVLINVTHHDADVCREVAARGGLGTLMSCLVAHDLGFTASVGGTGVTKKDSPGFLRRGMEVGVDDMPDGSFSHSADHEVDSRGKSGEAESNAEEFDVQVLTLGALINCVELRESVENCFLVGALRVPAWTPTGKKTAGLTISVKASDARCNAVEFLSRMLMKCTEGFAKHLEAGNGEDEAEGEQKMVPEGVEGGPSSPGDVLRQGKPGQESSPMRTTSGSQKGTPSLTTGVESEEAMTPAEGAQLVLAGHCALLLGLLVREHEPNRRMALAVLPDHSATLIVRVLEAFMALQWQAGVLTEEVVLAVQELVEDLEGLDPLSEGEEDCKEEEEEENPYTLDNEDPPTESVLSPATASPVKKHRKRPRSPTRPLPSRSSTTLPLGQWASDNAEDVDEDEFEHSMSRARRKGAGGNNTARQRPQASWRLGGSRRTPWTPTPSRSVLESPGTRDESSLESPEATARLKNWRLSPTISSPSPTLPSVGRATGIRVGLGGLGSGGVAGTRTWLGKSSQRTYETASWRNPLRAIGDVMSTYTDQGPEAERTVNATTPAGEATAKNSCADASRGDERDGTADSSIRVTGPKTERTHQTSAISSIFELDMRSDSLGRSPQPESRSNVDTDVGVAGGLRPKRDCGDGVTLTMDEESKEARSPPWNPIPVKEGVSPRSLGVGPRSGADALARRLQQTNPALATATVGDGTSRCIVNEARPLPPPRTATAACRVYGKRRSKINNPSTAGLSTQPAQLPGKSKEQPKADGAAAGVWRKGSGGKSVSLGSSDAFEFENDSD